MNLSHPTPACHTYGLSSDVLTFVRNEKQHSVRNVLRSAFSGIWNLFVHPLNLLFGINVWYKLIVNKTRCNRVCSDIIRRCLHCETACKCHNTSLCCGLMGMTGLKTPEACNGSCIYNAAIFLIHHNWQHCPATVKYTSKRYINDKLPVFVFHICYL